MCLSVVWVAVWQRRVPSLCGMTLRNRCVGSVCAVILWHRCVASVCGVAVCDRCVGSLCGRGSHTISDAGRQQIPHYVHNNNCIIAYSHTRNAQNPGGGKPELGDTVPNKRPRILITTPGIRPTANPGTHWGSSPSSKPRQGTPLRGPAPDWRILIWLFSLSTPRVYARGSATGPMSARRMSTLGTAYSR